jgi:hypothetical protein
VSRKRSNEPRIVTSLSTFGTLQSDVQVFFSDTATLGSYPVTVFDSPHTPIETVTLPNAGDVEVYVTFEEASADLKSIQIGPSTTFGDAFAIDDLSFNFTAAAVPEPTSLALLLSFGLAGLGQVRRKRG